MNCKWRKANKIERLDCNNIQQAQTPVDDDDDDDDKFPIYIVINSSQSLVLPSKQTELEKSSLLID